MFTNHMAIQFYETISSWCGNYQTRGHHKMNHLNVDKKALTTVISGVFIGERSAENDLFLNWHPALLKTWAEHGTTAAVDMQDQIDLGRIWLHSSHLLRW